jgi:hypothetical protein
LALNDPLLGNPGCTSCWAYDVKIALRGEFPHSHEIAAYGSKHMPCGVAVVAPRDFLAGSQALHIPFEWTGMCFVEIVEVEDQSPLGEANAPKLLR